jgi:hypothetical protein
MKPSTTSNQFFKLWESTSKSTSDQSSWSPSFLRSLAFTLTSLTALVTREVSAGLRAATKATTNTRLYTGVFLMLVVAPASGLAYNLFDYRVEIEGWYHANYWNLLFVIGPHIASLFMVTGVFLLFPQLSKRAYFLAAPAGYHIGKIIWIVLADSNEAYYRLVPVTVYAMAICMAILWLLTFDWLMGLHYHKSEGNRARMEGVIMAPGIPAEQKIELLQKLVEERRQLNRQY